MATHKLESRYISRSDYYGWIYASEAFWIITWLICLLILLLACVPPLNRTEPKRQWTSWFKIATASWTLAMTSEALTYILTSVSININCNSITETCTESATSTHIRDAVTYLDSVSAFLSDAAQVPVFINLLSLGLDITEAQYRQVRRSTGVVLKTCGFLLAGVLFALVVVDFGLIIEITRLQLLYLEGFPPPHLDPLEERIHRLARILDGFNVAIVVLFEVAALTSLIWAVVVAARGRNEPNKRGKVVTYFLVSCLLFLLQRSYPLVTTLKRRSERTNELHVYTVFLAVLFEGWPVTIVLMLMLVLRNERLSGL